MTSYFRTPEMQEGKGFRCPNCNKLLAVKVNAPCDLALKCPRCKAYIRIKMREPVPWVKGKEEIKKELKEQAVTS